LDQESLVRAMNCLATGLEAYNARG
jgi:hypothetical protein